MDGFILSINGTPNKEEKLIISCLNIICNFNSLRFSFLSTRPTINKESITFPILSTSLLIIVNSCFIMLCSYVNVAMNLDSMYQSTISRMKICTSRMLMLRGWVATSPNA